MPLEAQHLIVDVVRSERAEIAGSNDRGVFRERGDLVLMADQQGQLFLTGLIHGALAASL